MLFILHMLIWVKQRRNKVYLLSSFMALGATVNAMAELGLLHAASVPTYISLLKMENLAVGVLVVSLVWFVDLYLGTARRWLTILISVLWVIALIANFLSPASLVYSEIDALRSLTFWGQRYTIATGVVNPLKIVADVTILLIAIHALDASVTARRRRDKERAMAVGGSIVFFIVAGGIHSVLVDEGILETPYMVSFAFLAIVFALSYLLVMEVVKVPVFIRELQGTSNNSEFQ